MVFISIVITRDVISLFFFVTLQLYGVEKEWTINSIYHSNRYEGNRPRNCIMIVLIRSTACSSTFRHLSLRRLRVFSFFLFSFSSHILHVAYIDVYSRGTQCAPRSMYFACIYFNLRFMEKRHTRTTDMQHQERDVLHMANKLRNLWHVRKRMNWSFPVENPVPCSELVSHHHILFWPEYENS